MKMTIEKSYEFTVDTGKERKRIEKCWKPTQTIYKKLMKLMDLVEQEKWVEAEEFLDSEWWNGRDKDQECHRAEFIGTLDSDGAYPWDTYLNLVWRMAMHPDLYKVVKKK